MEDPRFVLYPMIAIQLVAWGWHQYKAGNLSDKHYIIFCGMMLCGQLGAGIECLMSKTWGTLVVQIYFFAFTVFGAWQRYRNSKSTLSQEVL